MENSGIYKTMKRQWNLQITESLLAGVVLASLLECNLYNIFIPQVDRTADHCKHEQISRQ
jgi:uncharacterized membrane protein SpoIIM required for sporulation